MKAFAIGHDPFKSQIGRANGRVKGRTRMVVGEAESPMTGASRIELTCSKCGVRESGSGLSWLQF